MNNMGIRGDIFEIFINWKNNITLIKEEIKMTGSEKLNNALKEFNLTMPFGLETLESRFKELIVNKSSDKPTDILSNYNFLKEFRSTHILSISKDLLTTWEIEEKDQLKLYNPCPTCHGSRVETYMGTKTISCTNCGGKGTIELKCRFCHNGIYKGTRTCTVCHGTSVWKTVNCNVCNQGPHRFRHAGYEHIEIPEFRICQHCNGRGKILTEPFNPVIRAGSQIMEELLCNLKK